MYRRMTELLLQCIDQQMQLCHIKQQSSSRSEGFTKGQPSLTQTQEETTWNDSKIFTPTQVHASVYYIPKNGFTRGGVTTPWRSGNKASDGRLYRKILGAELLWARDHLPR